MDSNREGHFQTESRDSKQIDIKEELLELLSEQIPEQRDKDKNHTFDISETKFWYIEEEQAENYLALEEQAEYSEGMHDAEMEMIKSNLDEFVGEISNSSDVIHLGCGNGEKSITIVEKAKEEGKKIDYYPVDISERLLEEAQRNSDSSDYDFDVEPLQADFEKMEELLEDIDSDQEKFLYLGATFVNFDPDYILQKISENMSEEDTIYFSAQISSTQEIVEEIIPQYENETQKNFLFELINKLGFEEEQVTYNVEFNRDKKRIEAYFEIKQVPSELQGLDLQKGDKLLVGKSHKPTLRDFSKKAKEYFDGEVITNENEDYAGFLGHKT
ncbi:MAG: L-histidine N(alpha)-methyltransferase [Candidatus Magasanikbacteria bacterium]